MIVAGSEFAREEGRVRMRAQINVARADETREPLHLLSLVAEMDKVSHHV